MISAPVTNREILPEERDKILEVEYHRRCQLRQQLQLSEEEIMTWMKRRSEKDRVRTEAGGPVRGQFKFKRYSQEDLEAALREVVEGNSVTKTGRKYNIPQRTLYDKIKKLKERSDQSSPLHCGKD